MTRDVCKHYGVKTLAACPPEAFIYPEFYPKGSMIWTLERLDYLDMNNRKMLCDELREVFLKEGSQAYGKHLLKRVRELGSSRHKERLQSTSQTAMLPKGMQARLDRIRGGGSGGKKSIIGMAEGVADGLR